MPKTILVVDDEPDILKVITFRLKKLGYDAIAVPSGDEALRLVNEKTPDLILLDYRLPDINGLEVGRLIRSNDRLKSVPIILISAFGGDDIEEALKRAVVDEYVKKPFEPEKLIALVEKYMR